MLFLALNILVFPGEIKVEINDQTEAKYMEDYQYDYHYQDKLIEEKDTTGGFKINGGLMLAYMELDLEKFNNNLIEGFAPLDDQLFLYGGGGIVGLKNGSRFGFYGLEGENSSISEDGKKIRLVLNYGGFLYEKGLYSSEKVDIAIGSLIGGGSAKVDMIYGSHLGSHIPNSNTYTKSFMVLEPRIDIHYQFAVFMGVDLSLGYFWTIDSKGNYWDYYGDSVNFSMDRLSSPLASLRFSFGF